MIRPTNDFFEVIVERSLREVDGEVVVLRPRELLCKDVECEMSINNVPLYRDDDHLNSIGSKLLGKLYLEKYSDILSFVE